MKQKLLAVRNHTLDVDVVLLLSRLYVGYAFMLHGWGKIQSPMSWMGPESPVPGVFQALAALAEFGGGLGLILGLLFSLSSLGILITMVVAAGMHLFVMGDSAVNMTGGRSAEPAIVYLFLAALYLVIGPGKFSIDRKIFGTK